LITSVIYQFNLFVTINQDDSRYGQFPADYFSALEFSYEEKGGESVPMAASLYFVTDFPPRTKYTSFSVSENFTLSPIGFLAWNFNLPYNSNITVTACTSTGTPYSINIIRGFDNFDRWKDNFDSTLVVNSTLVQEKCPSAQEMTYNVNSIDDMSYYIAYSNSDPNADVSADIHQIFEKYQYTTSEVMKYTQHSNCTIRSSDGGSCLILTSPVNNKWILITDESNTSPPDAEYNVRLNGFPRSTILGTILACDFIMFFLFQFVFVSLAIWNCAVFYRKSTEYQKIVTEDDGAQYDTFGQEMTTVRNPMYVT
jgi:hypothetical protein